MKIYTSTYPPLPPPAKVGLFEFLFNDNPNINWDNKAVVDVGTGSALTYRNLHRDSLRFAQGLTTTGGLKRGETLLIFSPNQLVYPALCLAGQAAGLTVSTANSSYTPTELQQQLETSRAKLVLVGGDLVAVAREACKSAGLGDGAIWVLPGMDGRVKVERGLKSFERLRGKDGFKPIHFEPEELETSLAYLPFSSGTTGRAKGVAISQRNMLAAVAQMSGTGMVDAKSSECVMACLPLYHIYGLVVSLHQTIRLGGMIVLMPKFDLNVWLDSVQKYKATIAFIVPPIALALAKAPQVANYDLSSLQYLVSGAAPLSAELQKGVENRLNGQRKQGQEGKTLFPSGWGMSETTSVGLLPDVRDGPIKSGIAGKLLPGMEARLVDEGGKDVNEGEAGELWLRGPNIMVGYLDNEKANKETFKDGWMSTGDVCVRSKDGDYAIVDRRKELIKYKGFQVPPAELEAVLLSCPLVADAAVIGVQSEELATELPRAYIVPDAQHAKGDLAKLAKDVQKFVEGKVAPHKRLRGGVFILEVIPKSPSGKILRKDLRVLAAKEDKGAQAKL